MTHDTCKDLARHAFDGMDEIGAPALRVLAQGLALAERPLRDLSTPLDCYADTLEFADIDDRLAVINLAYALRIVAGHPGCADLIERLEPLDGPPWPQIREALLSLTTDERPPE